MANILNNAKGSTDKLERSGVYRIQCDQCSASYIGQTQRALKQRLKVHLRTSNDRLGFAQHLKEHKHSCTENHNIKLLHHETNINKLLLLEMFEIDKAKKNLNIQLLNDQTVPRSRPMYLDVKFSPLPSASTEEVSDRANLHIDHTTIDNSDCGPNLNSAMCTQYIKKFYSDVNRYKSSL